MVVAISVSLVVFSAVLYTRGITAREISRAYLGTNPASATVVLDRDLDAAQMAQIAAEARTRPGIIDATARVLSSPRSSRTRTGGGRPTRCRSSSSRLRIRCGSRGSRSKRAPGHLRQVTS